MNEYTISINGQVIYRDNDHDRARRTFEELKVQTSGYMLFKDGEQILDDRASLIILEKEEQS